jgi:hypothetical protein
VDNRQKNMFYGVELIENKNLYIYIICLFKKNIHLNIDKYYIKLTLIYPKNNSNFI